ncbi:MAG: hypothetical protein IH607_07020 [Firmicutes bacterium]|nr:hypothetical protein [Bacillota bacterium]
MNSFTNTILTLLLGWLRTLLNAARGFISSDASTAFFSFFRENWKTLFVALCIVGFALDMIVYLVRWRPQPVWARRRPRRRRKEPYPEEAYDFDSYYADTPAIATDDYEPVPDAPYGEYAGEPTVQYQIQSRQGGQPVSAASVTLPYTTPYFAPEANAYQEEIPQLYTDEPVPDLPPQPAETSRQRYAFGMAPSFGSAQSEPTYHYQRDSEPTFAPPQYAGEFELADAYQPPPPMRQADEYAPVQPQTYAPPRPRFRPFSDRAETDFSPPRTRGFGGVAKRARNLLNADEIAESLSYKDFQPTVDVSQAFHSPVYPEKKPEGDA